MGNIHLNITNSIEKDWRDTCGRKFGVKKGCLQKGMEEALLMWIAQNPKKEVI